VTVFCTSMSTQLVSEGLWHIGPLSTAVKRKAAPVDFGASFISMSVSTISPVDVFVVVVVEAITPSPWSQQS
jgi:hypothetical protein